MSGRLSRWLAPVPLLAALAAPGSAVAAPPPDGRGWLGEELPLPLAVRTAQDLAVKAAAEKQYLIFNLIAGGKLAWDQGDFATAAGKWEALLRVHDRVERWMKREGVKVEPGGAKRSGVFALPHAARWVREGGSIAHSVKDPLPGS